MVKATGDANINTTIADEARHEGVWLNVVDDPERSTFFFTALHRDGDVTGSGLDEWRLARPLAVCPGPRGRGAARQDCLAWLRIFAANGVGFTTMG